MRIVGILGLRFLQTNDKSNELFFYKAPDGLIQCARESVRACVRASMFTGRRVALIRRDVHWINLSLGSFVVKYLLGFLVVKYVLRFFVTQVGKV